MEAFLVKVWRAGGAEPYEGFRGTVVHLRTGQQVAFTDPKRLLDFLSRASDGGPDPHRS
jgi:hypothetical protein